MTSSLTPPCRQGPRRVLVHRRSRRHGAARRAAARGAPVMGCEHVSLLTNLDTGHSKPSRSIGYTLMYSDTPAAAPHLAPLHHPPLLAWRALCAPVGRRGRGRARPRPGGFTRAPPRTGAGRGGALPGSAGARLRRAPPRRRVALRGEPHAHAHLGGDHEGRARGVDGHDEWGGDGAGRGRASRGRGEHLRRAAWAGRFLRAAARGPLSPLPARCEGVAWLVANGRRKKIKMPLFRPTYLRQGVPNLGAESRFSSRTRLLPCTLAHALVVLHNRQHLAHWA